MIDMKLETRHAQVNCFSISTIEVYRGYELVFETEVSLWIYDIIFIEKSRNKVDLCDKKRELHVTISQPNNRLFVGSIPKTKTKDEIFDEFHKHTSGLTEVILYYQVDEKNKVQNGNSGQKNRGFCFLEYDTHQAASQARRRLLSGRKLWYFTLWRHKITHDIINP